MNKFASFLLTITIGGSLIAGKPQAVMALTVPEIEIIAQQITVQILSATKGSGVIVARQNDTYYVLTARHVVDSIQSGEEAEIQTHDGEFYLLNTNNIQKLPNYLDLALVEFTSSKDYPIATISEYHRAVYRNRDYQQGISYDSQPKPFVFVSGWPLNNQRFVFNPGVLFDDSGTSLSNPDILNPEAVERDFRGYEMTYTNLTAPGMSGGPVLDADGRLIAIHGRADGKLIDENDQIVREYLNEARLNAIRLKIGLSAGIPITTFLSWVEANPQLSLPLTTVNKPPSVITDVDLKATWQPEITVKEETNPLHWLELGNQLWRLEQYTDAIAAFDQAIKINDNLDLAWFARGFTLGFEQQYQKAFEACARATQIKPEDYNAWRCRAGALQELQKYEAALNDLNRALSYNDQNPADWATKGELLIALEEYNQALVAYETAIKLRKSFGLEESPILLNNYGLTLLALGKAELASDSFEEAIAINPNYPNAWSNLGWAYSELGRYDESLEAYNRAISLEPDSANIWYNRGVTLYQLGLDAEAIASFEKALTIDDDYQPALEAIRQLQKGKIQRLLCEKCINERSL